MSAHTRSLLSKSLLAAVLVVATTSVTLSLSAKAAEEQAGTWQMHKVTFNYLGIQPVYSCTGLNDQLTFLLQESGARLDKPVFSSPCRGGAPTKLLTARLQFSTLQPQGGGEGETGGTQGTWRHVEFSPQHSAPQLRGGDCELVQEFKDKLLPMFATRNVQENLHCVPYQTTGYLFSLTFDVFVPTAQADQVGGAVGRG